MESKVSRLFPSNRLSDVQIVGDSQSGLCHLVKFKILCLDSIPEERDGIFETIHRNKNHYQKRAYQCIKFMVNLFTKSPHAFKIMRENPDMKEKWYNAVDWLHDEMERVSSSLKTPNFYYVIEVGRGSMISFKIDHGHSIVTAQNLIQPLLLPEKLFFCSFLTQNINFAK